LSYQENELIVQHVAMGHEVTVIAATDTYGSDKSVVHVPFGKYQLQCGAQLIRLPYVFGARGWLARKIRAHSGLSNCLESINPDRILFHGLSSWDLLSVAKYVQRYQHVKLYADCHEDFNNSAKTWASRELLHKRFYKLVFQKALDQISEVLCVTVESLDFAINFYDSPSSKTRIFPLGSVLESALSINQRREVFRKIHAIDDSTIVITQTGKLDCTKQLEAALTAFHATPSTKLRFVIAGRMTDDVRMICLPLIQADSRILDLGWQSTEELRTILAGADFFLQPFGQTVTTQMAMGYGCVILAQELSSHRWLVGENGRLFRDSSELGAVYQWVLDNLNRLPQLKEATLDFAKSHLDYQKLAMQIVS
jgi:glycosyltransferase involved in cell wall biosynthesis